MMPVPLRFMRKSAFGALALLLIVAVFCGFSQPLRAAEHSPLLDQEMAGTPSGKTVPVVLFLNSRLTMDDVYPVALTLPMSQRRDYVVTALKNRFHEMGGRVMERLEEAEKSGGADHIRPLWIINSIRASLTTDLIKEIDREWGEVAYITCDQTFENTLDNVGWGVTDIQAPAVWSEYGDGSGVVLGHKDSGVDITHAGFSGHIWMNAGEDLNHNGRVDASDTNGLDDDHNGYVDDFYGWNFDDDNNNVMDRQGHGTKTASTISANFAPCDTVSVAPGAKLMVLSGYLTQGASWESSQYAVDNGAQVISQSFSFKQTECSNDGIRECPNYVAHRMVAEMELAAGLIHANSTGNEGTSNPVPFSCAAPSTSPPPAMTPRHPQQGGVSSSVAVSAYNVSGGWESYSGRGPSAWSRTDICIHSRMPFCGPVGYGNEYPPAYNDYPYLNGASPGLLRPDVTSPTNTPSLAMGGGCGSIGGTSGATPHVGGVCALIYSAFPGITPERAYLLLVNNTLDMGPAGPDSVWGFGKIRPLPACQQGDTLLTEITGQVTSGGSPLSNAVISGAGLNEVETDASGHYTLWVMSGTYPLRCRKFGYIDRETTVVAVGGTQTQNISLDAAQAAAVTVTTALDGVPQGAVGVTLLETATRVHTNANGTWIFDANNTRFTFVYGGLPWDTDTVQVTLPAGSSSLLLPLTRSSEASLPVGPDARGYRIYDRYDTELAPYQWIEINPAQGGWAGVTLVVGNDNTTSRTLPFTFRYYGASFTQITISANGFIIMGTSSSQEWGAEPIPSTMSPNNYLAPFFRDWQPSSGGGVYYYSHPDSHFVVVEWYNVPDYNATGHATFEAILYDPAFYPTPTNDGVIKYQYKRMSREFEGTIGLENADGTGGLQYVFQRVYDAHAAPADSGMALVITTENLQGAIDDPARPVARTYELYPNYPNPFNPSTVFSWSIPQAGAVRLALYDITGREAAVVFDGLSASGVTTKTFHAEGLATGVYFARLESAGKAVAVRKVLLLK